MKYPDAFLKTFYIDYDTNTTKGLLWLRIKANSKEEALEKFKVLVPEHTVIRQISWNEAG